MRHIVNSSIAILFLVFVTACSGGGGGEGGSQPSNSPPPLLPPPPAGTHSISGTVTETTLSGSVYARLSPGVTLTVTPGGATAITDANGRYEVLGLPDGDYTITPSLGFRPFDPIMRQVRINGANVASVDFTQGIPTLDRINLFLAYIGIDGVGTRILRIRDLLIGSVSTLMQNPNIQPITLVPFRGGGRPRIAYDAILGGPVRDGGIRTIDLQTLVQTLIVPSSGFFVPGFASATMGRAFDTAKDPVSGTEYVTLSSPCAPGVICPQLQNDVFVVIADGSLMSLRVTFDGVIKRAPSFGGRDPVTGYVKVLYFKLDTGEIWQQVIDPTAGVLVGGPSMFRSGVMEGARTISVSQDYAYVAFMGDVNGQSHIIVKTLATGAEKDLGSGSDPRFALDGSNLLTYTDQSLMFAVYPDGTGKLEVLVPGDLYPGTLLWVTLVSMGP